MPIAWLADETGAITCRHFSLDSVEQVVNLAGVCTREMTAASRLDWRKHGTGILDTQYRWVYGCEPVVLTW